MQFDTKMFDRLLRETKNAIGPLKVEHRELAHMLERQKITAELTSTLEKIAKEQGVIFAQTDQDFILLAKWYNCDMARAHRERFSLEELADEQYLAELRFEKLVREFDLAPIEDEEFRKPIYELENRLEAVSIVIEKSGLEVDDPQLGSLNSFVSITEAIKQEYEDFVASDCTESEELEADLYEFFSNNWENDETLVVCFLPKGDEYNGEELPVNELQMATEMLAKEIASVVADIQENYRHFSDIREALEES